MFNNFTVSDWIEFWGIISSFVISSVAIFISVITLRQNNKMIEESTRPNISIYLDEIRSSVNFHYIVIKNFGTTSAKIKDFSFKVSNPKVIDDLYTLQLNSIAGLTIAPNQSKIYGIHFDGSEVIIDFNIVYSGGIKDYNDSFTIDYSKFKDVIDFQTGDSSDYLKKINESLLAIVKRTL